MPDTPLFAEMSCDLGSGVPVVRMVEVKSPDPRKVPAPPECIRFRFMRRGLNGLMPLDGKLFYPHADLVLREDLLALGKLDEDHARILLWIERNGVTGAFVTDKGQLYPYRKDRDHTV